MPGDEQLQTPENLILLHEAYRLKGATITTSESFRN